MLLSVTPQDNKVNGVTDCTRIMGYSFLYPSVLPRPHVHTLALTPQDEFFVLGSRGLWDAVSPEEAVEAVRAVPDALAAAKKLCTLAQGYGCTDSLSAVVVRLSVSEDCCCCCCSAVLPHHPAVNLAATGGQQQQQPSVTAQHHPQPPPSPGLYPPGMGMGMGTNGHHHHHHHHGMPGQPSSGSELSSEVSTSEMSSEVGSTASSDEPPLLPPLLLTADAHLQQHLSGQGHGGGGPGVGGGSGGPTRGEVLASSRGGGGCCALHAACLFPAAFQRQLSSTTFCSGGGGAALSDNALDSEDEEPIAGVFSNGSRVEVEADVHCRGVGHASPTDCAGTNPLGEAGDAIAGAEDTVAVAALVIDDPVDASAATEEVAEAAPACTPAVADDGVGPETPSARPAVKENAVVETTAVSAAVVVSPNSNHEALEEASEILPCSEVESGVERERETGQARVTTVEREKGGGGGAGGAEQVKTLGRRQRGNGSVAPQERSHNLIEVAAEAPCRKPGGYFTAPAQPDPDDQFIIPPELEEEVKEIMKQHQQEQQRPAASGSSEQPSDYYDTPL